MRHATRFLCLASIIWLLAGGPSGALSAPAASARADETQSSYRPGALIVRLAPGLTSGRRSDLLTGADRLVVGEIPELDLALVSVPLGTEPAHLASLRGSPGVISAELDYLAYELSLPSDPGLGEQWSLGRINAPSAWNVVTGSAEIVIAVIDSGIDLVHPDLSRKLWFNPNEQPANGLDDDGNGKVDDLNGWHFWQRWIGWTYVPAEDANVADDYGHGTHVAGIAAAETDNGIGIAGISWGARLMPVKVIDRFGNAWYSDIIAGLVYAADNGAQIINLSLGGAPASSSLCAAAAYAWDAGALLVAATGNDHEAVLYPAACEGVLGIGAVDRLDQLAPYSNVGPGVDLSAPGNDIYSTWYYSSLGQSGYLSRSGTSMAAPHVAGAAALVWSQWTDWSNDQVADRLLTSAVDLDTQGWDPQFGWGRIDAALAVGAPIEVPTPNPSGTPTVTGTSTPTAWATARPTASATVVTGATPTVTPSPTSATPPAAATPHSYLPIARAGRTVG